MNTKQQSVAFCLLVISLFASGCGPGRAFGPTYRLNKSIRATKCHIKLPKRCFFRDLSTGMISSQAPELLPCGLSKRSGFFPLGPW